MPEDFNLSCPLPHGNYPNVLLAHGGGGRLMHQLITELLVPGLAAGDPAALHDGALLQLPPGQVAFTTDSYVVRPHFFPGGDIGSLAVNGTVNDLAMCGARPLYLSCGLILEEGFAMEDLRRVLLSMQQAAREANVRIVTGDTKVVDRGKGDGIFINSAGVGVVQHHQVVHPSSIKSGDVLLLSGDVGRHGIAIMAAREGLEFETTIQSDCAPLAAMVLELFEAGVEVHCLRDLTRGGLASVLVEIAEAAGLHLHVREAAIAVREDVAGACEILGLDPLYVANEGRLLAFVPEHDVDRALEVMRRNPQGAGACLIGKVSAGETGVTIESLIGATRVVDLLSGEQLPRIC